jgi:hypothetical protein
VELYLYFPSEFGVGNLYLLLAYNVLKVACAYVIKIN